MGKPTSSTVTLKEAKKGKKRKLQRSTSPTPLLSMEKRKPGCSAGSLLSKEGKRASELGLEDVSLSVELLKKKHVKVGKEQRGEEEGKGEGIGRSKKKSKLTNDKKGKGKDVSALELLVGTLSTSKPTVPTKSNLVHTDDLKLDSTSQTIPTTPDPTRFHISDTVEHNSLQPSPLLTCTATSTQIDPTLLLKQLKQSLRTLSSTLTTLSTELELIDTIWYKNASQFKSAFWWSALDSSRRSLHKLLLPSPHFQLGLARVTVNHLSLVYAGIGGGLDEFRLQTEKLESRVEDNWPTLPKLDAKPSTATILAFLNTPQTPELIHETKTILKTMQQVLEHVKITSQTAGKVLVTHINTPPAPTFAPQVCAILAIIANIHSLSISLVGQNEEEQETREKSSSVIQVLTNVLQRFNSNIQSDANRSTKISRAKVLAALEQESAHKSHS